LKGELKFDGFVVSDWEDVVKLHSRDKVASSPSEAVRMSVMAGMDMSMVPYDSSFFDHCVSLAKKDETFLNRVNDATMRILGVKQRLGLLKDNFESILPVESDLDKIGTNEAQDFNLEAARESIILAKNRNDVLPLSKSSNVAKILVTGPTANLRRVMNGGWSHTWQVFIQILI
jgi:beta-glucosidase